MLDSLQSQSMYRALKAAGGFQSPAGEKASAAREGVDSAVSSIDTITDIPEDGSLDDLTGLPINIPPEITSAAEKLKEYKANFGTTGATLDTLNGAISKRMADATGNMAIMGTAAKLAQNMGEVDGGCGPLGAAFAVLTSTADSDDLKSLLGMLPLDDIQALFDEALNGGGMTDALRAQLAAAMATMGGLVEQVLGKNSAIGQLVGDAEDMWNELESTFKHAVQTSVLMSVLKNPCLQGAAEAIMPEGMRSAWSDYSNG